MKKILIVDVPEWRPEVFEKERLEFFARRQVKCTEFTHPSDEEIEKRALNYSPQMAAEAHFINGANWFKSLLQ